MSHTLSLNAFFPCLNSNLSLSLHHFKRTETPLSTCQMICFFIFIQQNAFGKKNLCDFLLSLCFVLFKGIREGRAFNVSSSLISERWQGGMRMLARAPSCLANNTVHASHTSTQTNLPAPLGLATVQTPTLISLVLVLCFLYIFVYKIKINATDQ